MKRIIITITLFITLMVGAFAKAPFEIKDYNWTDVTSMCKVENQYKIEWCYQNKAGQYFDYLYNRGYYEATLVDSDGSIYYYFSDEYSDVASIRWHLMEAFDDNFEVEWTKYNK